MVIFVAPVSHCVELALFAVDFSGKFPKYVAAVPHLHSIHPSITRESKWRYIMKKINLRELYPDVYTTDFLVDVTEEVNLLTRWQSNLIRAMVAEHISFIVIHSVLIKKVVVTVSYTHLDVYKRQLFILQMQV